MNQSQPTVASPNTAGSDNLTRFVYGQTFARYNRTEFDDFLNPLEVRLRTNRISPENFEGKLCLDAGCGGGRGTILMAKAGAGQVIAFDLAEQNCETTRRRAREHGFENVETQCGSLLELPFDDATFDIVWCNGVLHHTTNPGRALSEVSRVLKPGGRMWLYLYGSGGIYWYFVDVVRHWLRGASAHESMAVLTAAGFPAGKIAEFLDDWHVPNLKRYRHEDVARSLRQLGFDSIELLTGGMPYDSSVNREGSAADQILGEGDLRYWVQKTSHRSPKEPVTLPDVEGKGSFYQESAEVLEFSHRFQLLDEMAVAVARQSQCSPTALRILVAANLQTRLRELLPSRPFDLAGFGQAVENYIANLKGLTTIGDR
jgi:ubiquinone/menaquinone biosynthesis C-methylase UbiE